VSKYKTFKEKDMDKNLQLVALKYFNAFVKIENEDVTTNTLNALEIIKSRGIVSEELPKLVTIEGFEDILDECGYPKREDLLKTFFGSLEKRENVDDVELLFLTLLGYVGLIDPVADISKDVVIEVKDQVKVIETITESEFYQRVANLVAMDVNIPLIPALVDLVEELIKVRRIKPTNIKNRDLLKTLVSRDYSRLSWLGTEEAFQLLCILIANKPLDYKFNKGTRFLNEISRAKYGPEGVRLFNSILLELFETHTVEFAGFFNRYKKVFLAIKKIKWLAKEVKTYINLISRESKEFHKPVSTPLIKSVTSSINLEEAINAILESAKTRELVALANALTYRIALLTDKTIDEKDYILFVTNRLGGSYRAPLTIRHSVTDLVKATLVLKDAIKSRITKKAKELGMSIVVDKDSLLDIAIPYTLNEFCGNIPNGSTITYPFDDSDYVAVGVTWYNTPEGQRVDLDLSVSNESSKIGWDGSYGDSEVVFSGDITDAENGAAELLYFKRGAKSSWKASVNWYNHDYHEASKVLGNLSIFKATEASYLIDDITTIEATDMFTLPLEFTEENPGQPIGSVDCLEDRVLITFVNSGNRQRTDTNLTLTEYKMLKHKHNSYVSFGELFPEGIIIDDAITTLELSNPVKDKLLSLVV
jgi:hypothetical protein